MNHGVSVPTPVRGFTLLEAIVAMTIFSMCALALFGWLGTSLRSLDRVEARNARAEYLHLGLAVMQTVNPMIEPKGDRTIGDRRVRWVATPIEPVRTGVTQYGLPSLFDVGLFDVLVTVQAIDDEGSRNVANFHVRVVGHRQVRETGFNE